MKAKKQFLKSYLLQETKIRRLSEMPLLTPQEKKKYLAQIKECKRARDNIENAIAKINDDLLREVLYQTYICGRTLEETSLIINYSKRHTERLHIKALHREALCRRLWGRIHLYHLAQSTCAIRHEVPLEAVFRYRKEFRPYRK